MLILKWLSEAIWTTDVLGWAGIQGKALQEEINQDPKEDLVKGSVRPLHTPAAKVGEARVGDIA